MALDGRTPDEDRWSRPRNVSTSPEHGSLRQTGGGRDSGLQVLAHSSGWSGISRRLLRSRQIGLALLRAARPWTMPPCSALYLLLRAERSVLAGPTSRQLCDGGWVAKTVVSPWLPSAEARPASSLHSLSPQPQRLASGLRNQRNAVQLTERGRNDRCSIGSGTLCDAAVASVPRSGISCCNGRWMAIVASCNQVAGQPTRAITHQVQLMGGIVNC